jgi:hypothetical protein
MSITTIDGAIAGMQPPVFFSKALTGTMVAGRPHSLFYLAGVPGAGSAPSPGIDGEVLTSVTGQLPFTNPVSGNTYLSRMVGRATIAGVLMLCDRLWQNSGYTITSTDEQTSTADQIPARDMNGTNNGAGVFAAVEVSGATGAGTPTLTLKYTDQGGNADAVATNMVATVASSIAGTFYPIGLAAGDTGIQKVQSLTLSATWTSGTIHVVLYRIIAALELTLAHVPTALDVLSSGFPRIYDNTCPFLVFWPSTTTTSNISGVVNWTQG